jgi:hypothetical protein
VGLNSAQQLYVSGLKDGSVWPCSVPVESTFPFLQSTEKMCNLPHSVTMICYADDYYQKLRIW